MESDDDEVRVNEEDRNKFITPVGPFLKPSGPKERGALQRAEAIAVQVDAHANRLRELQNKLNGANVSEIAGTTPVVRKGLPAALELIERRLADAEKFLSEISGIF